ncbi:MAG: family 1 encapsulin nanocompartment shell protein, partial [Methanothrix sp.]|nr:family 1 encapsulin nanocompartment shell protein [Methanothrix sp.]
IFQGTRGLPGLISSKGVSELKLSSWDAMGKAVEDVISAVTMLDKAGFHGPYSLALAPNRYNLLFRRYPQGGTELEYIQALVTEGVLKAPIMESGGVLMASGRQYAAIVLGQDMSLGFIGPAGSESLEFSLSESIALLIREPKAICVLK